MLRLAIKVRDGTVVKQNVELSALLRNSRHSLLNRRSVCDFEKENTNISEVVR